MSHLFIRTHPTNTCLKIFTKPSYSYYNTLLKRLRSGRVNWVVPNKGRHFLVQSCGIGAEKLVGDEKSRYEEENNVDFGVKGCDVKRDNEVEYFANEFGWKVRRLANNAEEIRNASKLQAEAFHEPTFLFHDFFFQYFQAEVLAALIYKLRNSPPDRYACLVAEPESSYNIPNSEQEQNPLVGIVDVTALRDQNVLQNLPPDAEEYLYISGIAVSESFRRKKIATVLLKACDALSNSWGFKYLVLRAYEDDRGARELYSNSGYRVVSGDSPWFTTWLGRKRRVLMIKQLNQPSFKES